MESHRPQAWGLLFCHLIDFEENGFIMSKKGAKSPL
jgi:hypothetical protein